MFPLFFLLFFGRTCKFEGLSLFSSLEFIRETIWDWQGFVCLFYFGFIQVLSSLFNSRKSVSIIHIERMKEKNNDQCKHDPGKHNPYRKRIK